MMSRSAPMSTGTPLARLTMSLAALRAAGMSTDGAKSKAGDVQSLLRK